MSFNLSTSYFMSQAIIEAKIAFEKDEVPVGAIIVKNNIIIARAHNQNISDNDPTAHAEILAIRLAASIIKSSRLDDCDLYVTLEPCPMCAFGISLSRIKRIYYAASDEKFGGVENGPRIFNSSSCHHKPEIYSNISFQLEAEDLMKNFFKQKR
jgi:tRNA(adenine34) deaminase